MSNKTTLQSHNTRLQNLINTANSLPDAGSGGSGGIELCTCTVDCPSKLVGLDDMIWYSDGTGSFKTHTVEWRTTDTISVLKNSIIYVRLEDYITSDGAVQLVDEAEYSYAVFFVTGDCTLTFEM